MRYKQIQFISINRSLAFCCIYLQGRKLEQKVGAPLFPLFPFPFFLPFPSLPLPLLPSFSLSFSISPPLLSPPSPLRSTYAPILGLGGLGSAQAPPAGRQTLSGAISFNGPLVTILWLKKTTTYYRFYGILKWEGSLLIPSSPPFPSPSFPSFPLPYHPLFPPLTSI